MSSLDKPRRVKSRWLVAAGAFLLVATLGGLLGVVLFAPAPAGQAPLALPDLLHGGYGAAIAALLATAVMLKAAGLSMAAFRVLHRRKRKPL